jgi:hypothetical protein
MRKALLISLLLMAACSTPSAACVQYIECPDGDCQQQAQETCPKGYNVLHDADVGPDFTDFAKQHFAGAAEGVPHIIITCNP